MLLGRLATNNNSLPLLPSTPSLSHSNVYECKRVHKPQNLPSPLFGLAHEVIDLSGLAHEVIDLSGEGGGGGERVVKGATSLIAGILFIVSQGASSPIVCILFIINQRPNFTDSRHLLSINPQVTITFHEHRNQYEMEMGWTYRPNER